MKHCRKLKFECILVVLIICPLTIALFLFKNNSNIVEMIIIALTNSLVYVITKYFEIKDKENYKDKNDP